ncbi:MAG: hypothetical protein AAGI38_11235 [Bacteroidota bacterium]
MSKSSANVPLLIVGTGPEAREALEIANRMDVLVYGYIATQPLADDASREINDILIISELGTEEANLLFDEQNLKLLIAEGNLARRQEVVEQLKASHKDKIENLIHPDCSISPYAKLGTGCLFNAWTTIGPNVLLGSYNYLGSKVTIESDAQIGDFCTINSGVVIGKGASIAAECYIGHGAIIGSEVIVGEGALIAAGSVVFSDVEEGATVFGNPAQAK